MGTRTSVLYKAMAESGLGAAVVGGGVSDELKQATFRYVRKKCLHAYINI